MTHARHSGRVLSAAVAGVVATFAIVAPIAAQDDPGGVLIDDRRPVILAQAVRAAPMPDPTGGPAAADADDPSAGVFVRDSATAADKLALAERMERAQEWGTSADVYQEVLDGFSDRVVPTHHDAKGRADRFGSVGSVVQDRIAAWPAEGLQVYVARHASAARQMLENAAAPDDTATLARVVSRYFVTDAGRDAAAALAELAFDRGEFVGSATLCDRLLDRHPNLDAAPAADGAPPLRALLLARSAIAWRMAGEEARAAARSKTLAEKFPEVRATIGGRADASIAEVVAAEVARPRAGASMTAAAASWPQPFGSADHAAVAPEPAGVDVKATHEWARLLSFPIDDGGTSAAGGPRDAMGGVRQLAQQSPFYRKQREQGATTGILPSVDGGVLYFQDNVALHARDLATGEPPAGWLGSYPNDNGRFRLAGAQPTPRGAQMTVTLTDGRALAILGQTDLFSRLNGDVGVPIEGGAGGARIVCLDRATGKLLWQASPSIVAGAAAADAAPVEGRMTRAQRRRAEQAAAAVEAARRGAPVDVEQIQAPNAGGNNDVAQQAAANRAAENLAAVRASEPCGSVLVANDLCYVVTRGQRTGGFQDVYLCAFDLADGTMRFASHIASGNPPVQVNGDDAPTAGDSADSHLAYADGRVVVSTDLGAIASVDAVDGTIGWLALYPRPRPAANPNGFAVNPDVLGGGRVAPSYAGNPIVLRDGKVIAMPVDSEHLVVHDAATGRPLARVPMRRRAANGQRAERVDVLVGLAGDRLVLSSSWAVTVLDWGKLLAAANATLATPDAAGAASEARVVRVEDVLVNHRPVISPQYPDHAIRGRPFLTAGCLYVSTAQRLYRFTPDARRVLDQYPAGAEDLDARADESPGNVVAVDGNVIVAGSDRVAVYAELALLRRRLDASIAADPRAVAPRLAYAQAMYDTDRRDEALKWIDDAVGTITADGIATPGPNRDRIFDACLAMLRRLDAGQREPSGAEANVAVTPASARADQPIEPESRPFAGALVGRLSTLADTPKQQVSSRLARASVARRSGDLPAAVEAYQQLLDEPAWSSIGVRGERGDDGAQPLPAVPVRTLARRAIEAIVAKDASAYAGVEARARAELDADRARGGPALAGLFAVVDKYPNAQAAREAMALAAERVASASPESMPTPAELRRLGAQLGGDAQQRVALERTFYTLALARGDTAGALGRARRIAQLGGGADELPLSATSRPASSESAVAPAAQVVARLQRSLFDEAERRLPDVRADFANVPSFATDRVVVFERVSSILVPVPGRGDARNDRLLAVGRDERKLLVFKPGEPRPFAEIAVPNLTDIAAATWDGDRVYLSQPGRVTCVDVAKASVLWSRDAASIAGGNGGGNNDATLARGGVGSAETVEVAQALAPVGVELVPARGARAPGDEEMTREEQRLEQMLARANNDPNVMRAVIIQQRQIQQRRMVMRNQGMVINGPVRIIDGNVIGAEQAAGWVPDPANQQGTEMLAQLRVVPGGDAVIVTTTRGRALALGRDDGATRWQAALGTDRAPATAEVVGGDQLVLAGTDERASRLTVLDLASGRETLRREYASNDARHRIVNVAVSPEGFVAGVHADGVSVWDAGDGSPEPIGTWRGNAATADDGVTLPFSGSRAPEHVALAGGRLMVVAGLTPPGMGQGQPPPHVRVFDLLTAQPVRRADPAANQPGNAPSDLRLVPAFAVNGRSPDDPVSLRAHRDRVLIGTGQALSSQAVLDAQPAWTRALPDQPTTLTPQSPILVRGGLLIVGWPRDQVRDGTVQTSAQATLELYSRETLPNGREVGMAVDELLLGKLGGTNAGPDARRTRRQPDGPRLEGRFAAVDGGVYFYTNTGRLTFLPGAAK